MSIYKYGLAAVLALGLVACGGGGGDAGTPGFGSGTGSGSGGGTGGVAGDPQMVRSVNFLSVVPADSAIVPAGTGGVGRTETAILQFEVLDEQKKGIPGIRVEFTTSVDDVVALSNTTGTTNADGLVSATVSSKNKTASVVILATIPGAVGIPPTPSSLLTVANGVPVPGALDLSATKRVLNDAISGDSSSITVRLLDTNGNKIPDGFALTAGTEYGGVGDSQNSACALVNGVCSFLYTVQNPRSPDGKIDVLVSASTASGVTISNSIRLYATRVEQIRLFDASTSTTPMGVFSGLTVDPNCKAVWTGELGTGSKIAAPAGASLLAESLNSAVTVAVTKGSPVLDSLDGSRTLVNLTFSLDKATTGGEADLQFTVSAGSLSSDFTAKLIYPACTPVN